MRYCLLLLIALSVSLGTAPATQPATAPADQALWGRLSQIDNRAGQVKSLSANFEQEKFTALLRKPVVSSGRVRIQGSTMRWDTLKPDPSVLLIDQTQARIYYPAQKTLEVYPLDQRLGELAASPLPRLSVLKSRFTFQQVPTSEMASSADEKHFIALRLTPADASLREHVKEVRVLLDIGAGYIVRAEATDSDGERTVLSFKDVQLNVPMGDLSLAVPPGTAVVHPLQGLSPTSRSRGPAR